MLRLKEFKKLVVVLLALCFLAACGSTDQKEKSEGGNGEESSEGQLPEGYPDQTIDVIVGYTAGGGTDLSARNMVEALNKEGIVEQSFAVDNITGAGGGLAMQTLVKEGDEYMLNAVPEIGESIWTGVAGVDIDELKPIAQVATDYQLVCVPADSPYDTLEDLLEAMKEDPESLTIPLASVIGGIETMRWVQIAEEYGADGSKLNMVALEGANSALQDLLGGDADVTFVVPQLAEDHVAAGNIKALAVTTDERVDMFPDVPTLKEQGIDVSYYRTRGFWMNGDVSDAVADYWENAFEQMMDTQIWQDYVEGAGLLLEFKNREEYTKMIHEDGTAYQEFYESFHSQ